MRGSLWDNALLHSISTYMRASSSSSTQAAEATFDFNKASILNNYKHFKIDDKIANSYEILCGVYGWSHKQQKLIALNLNQQYDIGSTTDGMQLISLVVYSQSRLNNNQATCNVGFSLYN